MRVSFNSLFKIPLSNDENAKSFQYNGYNKNNPKFNDFIKETMALRQDKAVSSYNPKTQYYFVNIKNKKDTLFKNIAKKFGFNVYKADKNEAKYSVVIGNNDSAKSEIFALEDVFFFNFGELVKKDNPKEL